MLFVSNAFRKVQDFQAGALCAVLPITISTEMANTFKSKQNNWKKTLIPLMILATFVAVMMILIIYWSVNTVRLLFVILIVIIGWKVIFHPRRAGIALAARD